MRSSLLALVALGTLSAVACNRQGGSPAPGEDVGSASARQTAASAGAATTKGSLAQTAARTPVAMDLASLKGMLGNAQFERTNQLSSAAKDDCKKHHVRSVPTFAGSYTLAGQTYPYTMIGGDPRQGGTTSVKTTILPVSLVFDEFADSTGNALKVDVAPYVQPVVQSPDFLGAQYGTGHTQFQDAVQRAEFWNVMDEHWHTLLGAPRVQKAITIEVPVGAAQVFQAPDGAFITLLDPNFFNSQLTTIAQMADFHPDELAILLTPNVYLPAGGGVIIGFHTAWDAQDPFSATLGSNVQTFAWASYIEPGLFGGGFEDVTALSHEIAEWTNDPFIDNATENWAFPGSGGLACQNNLETGDPVEVLANPSFPVTIRGTTYHPQTEALLQWFTQEVPSSAFQGAYSYPDMTALTGPSVTCQ